jgi:hypothetical protein
VSWDGGVSTPLLTFEGRNFAGGNFATTEDSLGCGLFFTTFNNSYSERCLES